MKPTVVIERFDSLTSYANIIGKRTPNAVFSSRSLSSETGSESFTLTASYDDSVALMLAGYREGLKNLTASQGTRVSHTSRITKNLPTTDVVGYIPHIPNAITGIPQSMISTRPTEQKAKVITILYNIVDAGCVDANRFVVAGRNLLSVIMMLELRGYRVGLKILLPFLAKSRKQVSFCIVQIKHHRQPINPLKIAYPLLHPSFLRRQGFKWLETCPNVTDKGYSENYGIVLRALSDCSEINACRNYLRENNIMEDGCFYTEFKEVEESSADELIKKMGIKK